MNFLTNKSEDHGFTMVELLLTSVLLVLMSGVLYGTITGIVSARKAAQSQRETTRTANYVFSRLIREFSGRINKELSERDDEEGGDTTVNLVPQGNPFNQLRGSMKGQSKKKGSRHADVIRFVSASAAQPFLGSRGNFGLVEIEYRLEENSKDSPFYVELPGLQDNAQPLILVREEHPSGIDDKDIIKKRKVIFPIAHNIEGLNFRYLENGEWKDSWNEPGNDIPEAIEVALTIRSKVGQVERFKTAIFVKQKPKGRGFSRR